MKCEESSVGDGQHRSEGMKWKRHLGTLPHGGFPLLEILGFHLLSDACLSGASFCISALLLFLPPTHSLIPHLAFET